MYQELNISCATQATRLIKQTIKQMVEHACVIQSLHVVFSHSLQSNPLK